MKRIIKITFLLILLIPFTVFASSIKIDSVKEVEKSSNIEVLEEAKIVNDSIQLNVKFYDIDDYIKYKVVLENTSDKTFKIRHGKSELSSEYITYEVIIDKDNSIKQGEKKEVFLLLKYTKKIDKDKFVSGRYLEKKDLKIDLSNGEVVITDGIINNETSKNINPNTIDIILLMIFVLIISTLIIINIKKPKKYQASLLLLILLIPLLVKAIEEYQIEVESSVEIGAVKPNPCTYDGELENNVKYIKEQYEYIYSAEAEGWSLSLIDKESTDPVTSKICTRINDKPIVSMSNTFLNSKATSIDLSSFDTSHVVDMSQMFYSLENVTSLDLSTFDTRNVVHMQNMFANNKISEYNLQSFETPNLINMYAMFNNNQEITKMDLSKFDTSKVQSFGGIFYNCYRLKELNLSNWVLNGSLGGNFISILMGGTNSFLEKIEMKNADFGTSMDATFYNLTNLKELNLDNANTSKVTSMSSTFANDSQIKELDLSSFNTNNVTNMDGTFANMNSLTKLTLDNWDFSKIDRPAFFKGVMGGSSASLKILNLNNTKYGTNLSSAFAEMQSIEELYMRNPDTKNVTNMDSTFYKMTSLKKLDISGIDTSNVTSMDSTFKEAEKLTNIDVSDFDTRKVTSMRMMFNGTRELEKLDVTNFVTSSLEDMYMFAAYNPKLTKLDLSSFDVSNFTSISWAIMYGDYNITEVNLSNWNMKNIGECDMMGRMLGGSSYSLNSGDYGIHYQVKKIILRNAVLPIDSNGLFDYISTLEELDLTNADASNIVSMRDMFKGTKNLKSLDLSSFNTKNVTDMQSAFYQTGYNVENFKLTLSKDFTTDKVTNMNNTFVGIAHSNPNFVLDLSTFDFSSIGTGESSGNPKAMFSNDTNYEFLPTQKIYVKDEDTKEWLITNAGSESSSNITNVNRNNVLIK